MSGSRLSSFLKGVAKKWEVLYFFVPGVLVILLITIYPIFNSIWLSVHETRYLRTTSFAGLGNFVKFLTDPSSLRTIKASLIYVTGTVALSLPLGFILAVILNRDLRFKGLLRSIIILPWIMAQVVTALLWKWLLDPVYGPVAYWIQRLGLGRADIFGNQYSSMFALILANVWRCYPLAMILILASFQTVPGELYEAARIDGASKLQSFTKITFPLIRSTILITTILLTLNTFNMVTLILVLTAGGPFGYTEVLALRVYRESFEFWNVGLASAAGLLILAFNILFSIVYISIIKQESLY